MKTTTRDLRWALGVTAAGAAAMLFAFRAHWSPPDLDPGIEGCLTAGMAGFVMAMLHPLPYGRALALCAPVVVAEYFTLRHTAGTAIGAGLVGVQLVFMGFVGLALALHEPSPAAPVTGTRWLLSGRRPSDSAAAGSGAAEAQARGSA
jgi:hypothetical protein